MFWDFVLLLWSYGVYYSGILGEASFAGRFQRLIGPCLCFGVFVVVFKCVSALSLSLMV